MGFFFFNNLILINMKIYVLVILCLKCLGKISKFFNSEDLENGLYHLLTILLIVLAIIFQSITL